jgi:hypothetical protein
MKEATPMPLFDSISQLFQRDAVHLERVVLRADHISPAPVDTDAVGAGDAYFRLWLSEMFLKNDRQWFKTFYPLVQSFTTFSFGALPKFEIAQVAGPGRLQDVDAAHLEHIIQLNYALTPLVPFNGGQVFVEAGLVAMMMREGDLLQRFVDAAGSVSSLLAVPQLSTALSIAGTVSKAIDQLLGVSDKQMRLGYQDTFVGKGGGGGNDLRSAYIAAINAPSGTFGENQLWVKDGALEAGTDANSARPLTGADYILLRLEIRRERDDWDSLASISDPFSKAFEALKQVDANGDPRLADAEIYIRTAALAAVTSPDLTDKDRIRVARAIRDRYSAYKGAVFGARVLMTTETPSLAQVARESRALEATPLTVGELFSSVD